MNWKTDLILLLIVVIAMLVGLTTCEAGGGCEASHIMVDTGEYQTIVWGDYFHIDDDLILYIYREDEDEDLLVGVFNKWDNARLVWEDEECKE
jgi:hypothetical protein